jgi:BirA family transcriptional regulator, biotin operon repressor / biotin---[acetyl-CoA-carboxylase] ligase
MTEKEIQNYLSTKIFGRKIYSFDTIDSTNAFAKTLVSQDALEGTLVITEEQTAGKGRQNRQWFSEKGMDLTFSVILYPNISPERIGIISLLGSLAVAEAVESTSPNKPTCKWPNDVLIDGKKVCGILSEVIFNSETSYAVIMGIGLNVNQSIFPDELKNTATSLSLIAGHAIDRIVLLARILERLETLYDAIQHSQPELIIQQWKNYCTMFGKMIKIDQSGNILEGIAAGIADDGGLLVDTNKKQIKILAGDVSIIY